MLGRLPNRGGLRLGPIPALSAGKPSMRFPCFPWGLRVTEGLTSSTPRYPPAWCRKPDGQLPHTTAVAGWFGLRPNRVSSLLLRCSLETFTVRLTPSAARAARYPGKSLLVRLSGGAFLHLPFGGHLFISFRRIQSGIPQGHRDRGWTDTRSSFFSSGKRCRGSSQS